MDTYDNNSPAVWYSRLFGVVLTVLGIIGFFVTTSQDSVESMFGFDVNLTENIILLVSGVLGLAAGFAMLSLARIYAVVAGVFFLVLGIWGMVDDDPLGLFAHLNSADNVLHLAVGIIGLVAYGMSAAAAQTRVR